MGTPALRVAAARLGLCVLLVVGCSGVPARTLPIEPDAAGGAPRCLGDCGCDASEPLFLEYFGASGFRLVRGRDEILLGPFFSNANLLRSGPFFLSIAPDVETIHRYLPDVSRSQAIIVGHAHYDHLLDVPHIAHHHARDARVYVSETGASILAADRALDGRVESVDRRGWSKGDPVGHWIDVPGSRVRFLPIVSEHAPHFLGMKWMTGSIDRGLDEFPRTSGGWKEGQTFAFLIEFLGASGDAEYRVYYQDAATNWDVGMPPGELPVDVAIACVASFHEVEGQPETLLGEIDPQQLMLSHWEDFFAPYTQDPDELRSVPATDVPRFIERLRAAGASDDRFTLPLPGQRFEVRRCPR